MFQRLTIINSSVCLTACDTLCATLIPEGAISKYLHRTWRLRFNVLSIDYVRVTNCFHDYEYDYDYEAISAATAEQSFSLLKRLKTWLRNTMMQDRLTGLAVMNY